MNLLPLLVLAQALTPNCAAELKLRGVGETAVHQVAPYVECLGASIGTQEQLLSRCLGARAKAAGYRGPSRINAKVDRALQWLDAMTRERANCETALKVEA